MFKKLAMFIGAAKEEKLYGAFKFISATDRKNDDWSKNNVANSLYDISKIANKMLDEKNTHSVDIKKYNWKTRKWDLVSTKIK